MALTAVQPVAGRLVPAADVIAGAFMLGFAQRRQRLGGLLPRALQGRALCLADGARLQGMRPQGHAMALPSTPARPPAASGPCSRTPRACASPLSCPVVAPPVHTRRPRTRGGGVPCCHVPGAPDAGAAGPHAAGGLQLAKAADATAAAAGAAAGLARRRRGWGRGSRQARSVGRQRGGSAGPAGRPGRRHHSQDAVRHSQSCPAYACLLLRILQCVARRQAVGGAVICSAACTPLPSCLPGIRRSPGLPPAVLCWARVQHGRQAYDAHSFACGTFPVVHITFSSQLLTCSLFATIISCPS